MFRIYSYLVVLYVLFLSRWAIKLDTGVSHGSTIDVSSRSQHDQIIQQSEQTEMFMDTSVEKQLLPQEPRLQVVVLNEESLNEGDISTQDMGAHRTAASDIENIRSMDSTAHSVSYGTDSSEINVVTQTNIPNSEVEKTIEDEQSSVSAPEGSQRVIIAEATTSPEPSPVSISTSVRAPVLDPHLPALDKILEEHMHTPMHNPDIAHSSQQIPTSEAPYNFEIPAPTEALKPVTVVASEDVSKLPVETTEKKPEMKVEDDALFPTKFNLEEESREKLLLEEEFPTFDKWSMQYLAEQEKQKVQQQQEQAVNPSTLLVQKNLKRNFAAKSCGAKVVASNPEAENVDFVLNKNPDEYMLSPCKAKKWFVVELCEPLQIHKVDLGTTELFASQPKSFRLSTSQRFPTKEWIPLGKFDMTSDRSIQSFNTQVKEEFIKFVRVEMLEHHGEEYYCPITTFRVLGVDMASDDDEHNNEVLDSGDEAAVVNVDEDEVEESVNLFTSAKDAVVKLVKKVLFKEDHNDVKEEHVAVDNTTANPDEKKGEPIPCSDKAKPPSINDVPSAHIPEAGIVTHQTVLEEPKDVPIVTKLADTEQLPFISIETPVIIKLDKDVDTIAHECAACNIPSLCGCSSWNAYLQMSAYVRLQSSTCSSRPTSSTEVIKEAYSKTDKSQQTTDIPNGPKTTIPDHEDVSKEQQQTDQQTSIVNDQQRKEDTPQKNLSQTVVDTLTSSSSQSLPIEISGKIVPTQGFHQQKQFDEAVVASHLTSFSSSEVTATKSESLDPSSILGQTQMEDITMPLMTPDLDIQQSQVVEQGTNNFVETMFLKVSPTPTLISEDSIVADENVLQESPTAQQWTQGKTEDQISIPPLAPDSVQGQSDGQGNVLEQGKPQTSDKNVSGFTGGKTTRPIELIDVSMSSSSKKDISIMKLNNRIMALEQNVSMTKKYLEELSRAFKQQNEDMMKLLNKTEKRLNSYIGQSEERELRQQANIDSLEQNVANLTESLDLMQQQIGALSKELRGAQFLLAVFQAVLFLWLIISSYRSCSKPSLVYTDHQFLLDTMPTKPSFERAEKGSLQRRNSDVGMTSGVEQGAAALKRQISEANLASYGGSKQQTSTGGTTLFNRDSTQASKKRKKKRLKNAQLSLDSGSSSLSMTCDSSGALQAQSSSFSSSAGVLFGTNNSYCTKESINKKVMDTASLIPTVSIDSFSDINAKEPESCQKELSCVCHQYNSSGPVSANSIQGILVVKKDLNSSNISNSACSLPTTIKNSASILSPGTVSYSGRTPMVQINGHQDIPDTSFTKSPSNMLSASPEFHLPLYHKNKMRKLSEANLDGRGLPSRKYVKRRISLDAEGFLRRPSAGYINPDISNGYFYLENYMSENRFKFPASPVSSFELEPKVTSLKGASLHSFGSTFPSNGSNTVNNYLHPLEQRTGDYIPSILNKGLSHHKSLSSLPSSSSSQSSNLKSSSQVSISIPVQHFTTQASFISTKHIPQSISSREFSRTAEYGYKHDHLLQPKCAFLETGPVISSSIHIIDSASKPDSNQSLQVVTTSHTDYKANTTVPAEMPKTHRRQGSLPTDHLSKSYEKQSPPIIRKGFFEGSKPLKKSNSGIIQGSKVKRAPTNPTNINKRGSGSKLSSSDSYTSKKGLLY